ncbi:MAG TPA: glutamine--fructose-6-phosphate transaminase (isomerizing), partial [Gemmatimonadales bacterium]|nr:glutamine--fructose-6-phosphate transaminase (isomerizing) [Gemmatimonadales bacterium]
MCGIVGYVGPKQASPILIDGLRRMEYRGYDSAGVAVLNGGDIKIRKAAGKLSALVDKLRTETPSGTVGIGHTRWATHGAPTTPNAHPHLDQKGRIAVIHNGIIENSAAIRKALEKRGHVFKSETDTEVLAHLIGAYYEGNLEQAVAGALWDIDGAYGIAVISADEPDTLVAARNGSPLLVGVGDGEYFVASDASAILEHTRSVVYLDDGEMAVLTRDGYRVRNLTDTHVDKPVNQIEWDLATIERGGFSHFMLKEIFEQPESLTNTVRGHLLEEEGSARLRGLNLSDEELNRVNRVIITACGTSWHAGLIGEYIFEEMARIPCEVEYASEFRYRNPIVDENTLVIAVSQSGETADTLAAIREARRRGARTIGLVNVVGSTIAREVQGGLYLRAGPEIGVASTKAFNSQVAALAMVALKMARLRTLSVLQGRQFIQALQALPAQIRTVLDRAPEVETL